MKITRLFIIALMVISAGVFTSCKDYEEDNYNDLAVEQATVKAALQKQIDDLTAQLNDLKGSIPPACQCATKGYLTIEDLADYVKKSDLTIYATKAELGDYATNVALNNAIAKAEQELAAAKQALEGKIQEQANAIQTLNGEIATINGLLAQKADKSEVAALQNQITTLQNQLAEKADKTEITALQNQITALQNQLAEKADAATVNALTSRVEILEGKIPAIEQNAADALAKAESNYLLITALQQKVSQDSLVIMEALADSTKMLLDSIASVKEELKEYTDKAIEEALKGYATENYVDTKISELKTELMTEIDKKADKADLEALEARVDTLEGKVSTLESKVSDIMDQLAALQERIEEIVTDIKIQSVYNSAIGSLNTPLDINTNILVAYYGKSTEAISFPYSDYNLLYNSEDEAYAANETLIGDEGNAGTLYVTVNPSTADFTGLNVSLVNSQDEECAVKLGKLQKTDEVLTFGYSRAADNGFYAVPATLSKDNIYNSKLKINFDAGEVKNAVTDLVKKHNGESIKDFASSIFTTLNNLNNSLDAQAVKCTDSTGRSVYSNYDVAAVAVNPLGFKAVDEFFPRTSFPGYDKAKSLIQKLYEKAYDKLMDAIKSVNMEKYTDKLEQRAIIKVEAIGTGVDVTISYAGDEGVLTTMQELQARPGRIGDISDIDTVNKTFKVTYNSNEVEEFCNLLGLNDIANMTQMVEDLVEQVNNVIAKIDGDRVMNKVYSYLDKMNSMATKVLNHVPDLFHPMVLVNSDNGFGIAGFSGAPAIVKGDVTIYLTTGSAELVAPCFKKYYAIDDKYSGQLYEGTSVNLGTLSKGLHTIYYSALDYVGQRYEVEAQIYVE